MFEMNQVLSSPSHEFPKTSASRTSGSLHADRQQTQRWSQGLVDWKPWDNEDDMTQ